MSEEVEFELPPPAKSSRATVTIVVLVVIGGAFGFGYIRHKSAQGDVPVLADHPTRVDVIQAKILSSDHALELPGTVRPLEETRIYPRVAGYVKQWHADLGDKVTAGQLLAEIEAPELDAQLVQARAQLAQAQAAVKQAAAQREYSKSSAARYDGLSQQQLVAQAQVEQARAQAQTDEANYAAAMSNVASQEANVHRLVELYSFEKVTAPFAGTITARQIDRGALVSEVARTPLFTLVSTDPVRVFVDVPQTIAPSVKTGTPVKITVREYAGRDFEGTVARSAGALDPDLHTMTTEVRVPNGDGALLPGMYVQAQLTLPVPHKVLEIPATALYSDANGVRVATVDAQSKIHYVPITIERDTGATLHVATGLTGDEKILKIAAPALVEGAHVEVAQAPPAK